MFKHVVSYPDGEVVYHYVNEVITYPKDGKPIIRLGFYNKKKDNYGLFDRSTAIHNDIYRFSRDELYNPISTIY